MTDRFICTKETPWTKDKGRAIHPDAIYQPELDRDYGGGEYTETYKCPNCGITFEVELAQ